MAEITLRQARNLEAKLRNLKIEGQIVEIRAYDRDAAEEDINEGKQLLRGDIQHKVKLNDIRHDIKMAINVKNMECGISQMLNYRDALYEEKALLESIGRPDTTERQLKHIETVDSDYVRVNVVRQDMVDDAQDRLDGIQVELSEIQHSLNELNNSVTIPLDTSYLVEAGLL